MYLDKKAILSAQDLKYEDVEVPEWGGTVRVKELSAGERDQFEALTTKITFRNNKQEFEPTLENIRAKLVALSVVDENGNNLFTTADVKELAKKSASAMNRICEVASRLSGLGDEQTQAALKN
jgi:hypothetical protein